MKHVSSDALADYVAALEREVEKAVTKDPSAAGRQPSGSCNIFRLTGAYEEAAYLRELFDEPTTMYRCTTLIRTVDDASRSGSSISRRPSMPQIDALILS